MDEEEFDKRWHTCRDCGIKDGEDKHNWVFDNLCHNCREKRENKSDFEEAEREGKITRDDSIMCPYCGFVDDDTCEMHESRSYTCPECNKESDLEVDYTTHFTTFKQKPKDEDKTKNG